MQENVKLLVDALPTFSLVAQQNAYPLLKSIRLSYAASGERGSGKGSLKDLRVIMAGVPDWVNEEVWFVDNLSEGQTLTLPSRELKIPFDKLLGLTEELSIDLEFSVLISEETLFSSKFAVSILPADYWGGESRQPELLGAFVKPNGLYVESLVKQVADVLERLGHGRVVDGYQSNTRERPYLMLAALWNVIFQQKLAYVSPPMGFAKIGQRIRLASDISSSKIVACLDTSLLFASCIEAMGLNPVVAITEEHAFAGAWLIDERLPVLCNDDAMDIRKRVDNRDIILFETTLVTNSQPVTFEQSRERARELISEENEHEFVMVLDVAQARARQIKPLSTIEEKAVEKTAETEGDLPLPVVPPLPPVRADERVKNDTPETRIDTWSRKLLDLTKRNSLLNFSERATSIKLYCPDIASMEDMLADGNKFRFLSAEESPLNDKERDPESFRMRTGSDLHREFALNELQNKTLIANQSAKKLGNSSVALFRKAKNDMEEGGSNTLYLALGMLKWKENPDDDRSYRAPLILIPVSLSRRSARAPVYLEQLQDEAPLFNLTLIEFLYTEHDINLMELRDQLPEDESGVDVPQVWHIVREAISEQRGFEVVEELVLASFSFAKYLMWKDLRDRIEDLKENPFVRHLVDHPREAYTQSSRFVEHSKVDEKIDPADVYTPLNCDSSQLIAVEASGHSQDFVLEGPPGTGKSETIANIIAHNIGKGRKVLFVAEKMAALNVVYRRMQKVGLDHLCLELHSNKTSKRAVLDQLGKAWRRREGLNPRTWEMHLAELKNKKEQLNGYVRALHAKSGSGLSARDAIAGSVSRSITRGLSLDWPMDINASPFQTPEELKKSHEIVEELALAFSDISALDVGAFELVSTESWSNLWQSKFLRELECFKPLLSELKKLCGNTLDHIDFPYENLNVEHLHVVRSLSELTALAEAQQIDFAIVSGAKQRVATLQHLSEEKEGLDSFIQEVGHGSTYENVRQAPIGEWKKQAEEASASWFKSFFCKRKINSAARALGFSKFKDLSVVGRLFELSAKVEETEKLTVELERFGIWKGWSTSSSELKRQAALGANVRDLVGEILATTSQPVEVVSALSKCLVEGREYLETSRLRSDLNEFSKKLDEYDNSIAALSELGFKVPSQEPLNTLESSVSSILTHQAKLKSWCEWQGARAIANQHQLGVISKGLVEGSIPPAQAASCFYGLYCGWLAPLLIDAEPTLREFKASSHEQTISRFRELDEQVASVTSDYIVALASHSCPDPDSPPKKGEFGTLARELQKKTRHIPTRALINELGESLLNLCPCLMMSPLSVAQFLPSDFRGFDLVVFDEASQMTTWDSVGAIARGKNVIVVGDPKQMPPTNFFSAASSGDDPDEEDLESILDQALAAQLPLKRLMGHYRSKHETLIAFSNSKYYENSLVTYPSSDTKESVVSLRRIDGAYAKGKGRNNPIEAKALVDEVVKRLTDSREQKKSLGIVTLNSDQQRTIEDLLDDARRRNSAIEEFFHHKEDYDPVFVKNLESVQGDERDVIMLSLGYGPTEVGGKTMSMNFGPLNKTGGERRLNVAITRATTEVVVFSSFDSSMIDLSRTSSVAVEHLKHYLEFAERGPVALAEQAFADHGVDQFDSEFEKSVAFALREKGWKIQTQVGVSKFRVDLGIIHPDEPGVYLAGVECDGATYHSSPSARDRDRVRHTILESLGWNILRLWSTDYFVDPGSAIQKLDEALLSLLEKARENKEYDVKERTDDSSKEGYGNELVQEPKSISKVSATDSVESDVLQTPNEPDEVVVGFVAEDYFKESHAPLMKKLAEEILTERPAITIHSLALEIANRHGLSRTSKKQIEHVRNIIEPWAGIRENEGYHATIWVSPEAISEEVSWRGLEPFGYQRKWSELSLEEIIGLAKHAKKESPEDPVGFICDELNVKRRHEKTLGVFKEWLNLV